jgi:DNA-binding HxlR family transcriptional regulator
MKEKSRAPSIPLSAGGADVFSASCPSRQALELLASKWTLLIIPALAAGNLRNNELLRRVGGVSQKMLTQTLKDLERNGLVLRIDHRTVPPHVEYQLSPLGRSLSATLIALDRWAEHHHAELDDARSRFDRAGRRKALRARDTPA